MLYSAIDGLVSYGLEKGLITEDDVMYARNRILDVMREDGYEPSEHADERPLAEILGELTDIAVERGIIEDSGERRDIFDTRLMDCLMPYPHEVRRIFNEKYAVSHETATDWYYKLSCDSNYIRRDRIAKDRRWKYSCEYGDLDITVNLSKPEKDPRDIAAALKNASSAYPKCQLCRENEGYAGRIGHPARMNHRVIPVTLSGEGYNLQYSPYVYYNEHCIVFNNEHIPMKIDEHAMRVLLSFTDVFPHYFIGSNADLPIVGGSILTHDHFQGGRYSFAMERAAVEEEFTVEGFEDISCGIVKWPLTVLRISHGDPERLLRLASHILAKWRAYSDPQATVFAETDGAPHNTITPIARRRGGAFELDLCLRNNLTTAEHPMGLYHPHAQWHHIKKENIGLIEVMGLAVLPSRLDRELGVIEDGIVSGEDILADSRVESHSEWLGGFIGELRGADRVTVRARLEKEVGEVFLHVLEDAGVYKRTPEGREALRRFIATL